MSFAEATKVHQQDSHTYTANFSPDWVIGSVPHGGYVTSCFMTVVRKHFATTLQKQNQPHTITLHLDFLRRTQIGPATFRVKDVKLGRQTSIVHVTLYQDDREEVVGYLTNSDIHTEQGVTFPSSWKLHPAPSQVPSFAALEADQDPNWGERKQWPFVDFRKATHHLRSWFPRCGQPSQSCLDMWYCFSHPQQNFTQESLGFVCDSFPQIMESYLLDNLDPYSVEFEQRYTQAEQTKIMNHRARMWYPTLLLNLDVKKALPDEGVKWLFVRLEAKRIRNGRYDLEVLCQDEKGELVAVSNHVVFAVGSERNLAARRKVDGGGGESKL